MIELRRAVLDDLPVLVAQSALVPGGDARDARWFTERDHLVAVREGRVVGHTSWSSHVLGTVRFVTWDETVVEPDCQGEGIGRRLMEARLERTPGLVFGACHADNAPMVHLLTSLGFHPCQTIPGGFANGDAVLWSRPHGF
jgi:GNAT superfamily N-acetyltransferase